MAEAGLDNGNGDAPQHWSATLPAELQSVAAIKESPDLATFAKRFVDQSSEIGRRIPLPGKPEDAENWRKEHLPKLYKAGVLKAPPESHDKYEIKFSDAFPKHAVSEEIVNEYKQIAHKHGLPQDAVNDLLALNEKQFAGIGNVIKVNEEASRARVGELAKEYNMDAQQMLVGVENWLASKGYSKEQQEGLFKAGFLTGLPFLEVLVDAAMNSREADGLMGGQPVLSKDAAAAKAEARDIMTNPDNPKHALYKKNDAATVAYVTELLTKVDPGKTEL